jgi:uncharacterized protein (DUF2249 family)
MNPNLITLDVRQDFQSGEHPCDKIQDALNQVGPGRALRLLVPFEPLPLFEVARLKGLTHSSTQTPEGDWEIIFSPATADAPAAPRGEPAEAGCGCGGPETAPVEIVDVDARQLEPPQPMVKILETLSQLPAHAQVRARTDRRPIHLYPMLEARGFKGESEEQADGSFITHIRRI